MEEDTDISSLRKEQDEVWGILVCGGAISMMEEARIGAVCKVPVGVLRERDES